MVVLGLVRLVESLKVQANIRRHRGHQGVKQVSKSTAREKGRPDMTSDLPIKIDVFIDYT